MKRILLTVGAVLALSSNACLAGDAGDPRLAPPKVKTSMERFIYVIKVEAAKATVNKLTALCSVSTGKKSEYSRAHRQWQKRHAKVFRNANAWKTQLLKNNKKKYAPAYKVSMQAAETETEKIKVNEKACVNVLNTLKNETLDFRKL